MPATTTLTVTTDLDYTERQVNLADELHDALTGIAVLWGDRKDRDRRKLLATFDGLGVPSADAEICVEQYHRAVRVFVDALHVAGQAAKTVGDSHALMLGPINRHLRAAGRPHVSGAALR